MSGMEDCPHLIAKSQSAHSAHHPEHIIVGCIYTYSGAYNGTYSVVGDSQQQSGVINTR